MSIQIFTLVLGTFSTGLDFWLGLGRTGRQLKQYIHIYGPIGIFLPFLASPDVFKLVEQVLLESNDTIVLRFLDSQAQQTNMVAVVGSVVAGVATSGFSLKYLSSAHWIARSFMLASLLAGLFCVYYAMKQLRILGALITPDAIRAWLRSPPQRIRCANKDRPSMSAVLILDTPRTLAAMSAVTFIIGLSIYLVFVYTRNLDTEAGLGDSKDVVVVYFVTVWVCLALYSKADLLDYYSERDTTWRQIQKGAGAVKALFEGDKGMQKLDQEYEEEGESGEGSVGWRLARRQEEGEVERGRSLLRRSVRRSGGM